MIEPTIKIDCLICIKFTALIHRSKPDAVNCNVSAATPAVRNVHDPLTVIDFPRIRLYNSWRRLFLDKARIDTSVRLPRLKQYPGA